MVINSENYGILQSRLWILLGNNNGAYRRFVTKWIQLAYPTWCYRYVFSISSSRYVSVQKMSCLNRRVHLYYWMIVLTVHVLCFRPGSIWGKCNPKLYFFDFYYSCSELHARLYENTECIAVMYCEVFQSIIYPSYLCSHHHCVDPSVDFADLHFALCPQCFHFDVFPLTDKTIVFVFISSAPRMIKRANNASPWCIHMIALHQGHLIFRSQTRFWFGLAWTYLNMASMTLSVIMMMYSNACITARSFSFSKSNSILAWTFLNMASMTLTVSRSHFHYPFPWYVL